MENKQIRDNRDNEELFEKIFENFTFEESQIDGLASLMSEKLKHYFKSQSMNVSDEWLERNWDDFQVLINKWILHNVDIVEGNRTLNQL